MWAPEGGRGCHKDAHPFFFYYGIHSLMFGGYPPTAIGYTPTAIGYTPTAIGYPPTAIGYTPTAIGYPPTAIGYTPMAISYPPTAIGYPPATIIGRIGHSEFFFFFHYGTPWRVVFGNITPLLPFSWSARALPHCPRPFTAQATVPEPSCQLPPEPCAGPWYQGGGVQGGGARPAVPGGGSTQRLWLKMIPTSR